jgi:putative SOS response-associated peptidase YedK
MCGRYVRKTPSAALATLFDALALANLRPSYNVAPTQTVAVVRPSADGRDLVSMRWGLIPSWADHPGIGGRMMNARSDEN